MQLVEDVPATVPRALVPEYITELILQRPLTIGKIRKLRGSGATEQPLGARTIGGAYAYHAIATKWQAEPTSTKRCQIEWANFRRLSITKKATPPV
jgi:hypothetical protein